MRRRTRSSKRTTPAGPPGTAPRGRQPRAEPAAGGSYYRGMVATNDTRLAILKSAAAAFRRHGYHGATVEHIFVVFFYGIYPESKKILSDLGVSLHHLATWWDVLEFAKTCGQFDPIKLQEIEKFLHDPAGWSKAHGGVSVAAE